MVYKCSAYGCKSGYKGHKPETDVKTTFHAFPLANKELCDKWIKANPRSKDFVPTINSRLCSLHFKRSDFVEERNDSNKARRRRKSVASGEKLTLRYLKADAVPSIFRNAPKYLSTSSSGPRETVSATAASRREREAQHLDNLEQSFYEADDISSLSLAEIVDKLKAETALPAGFTIAVVDSELLIYWLQLQDHIPRIKSCIGKRPSSLDMSRETFLALQVRPVWHCETAPCILINNVGSDYVLLRPPPVRLSRKSLWMASPAVGSQLLYLHAIGAGERLEDTRCVAGQVLRLHAIGNIR